MKTLSTFIIALAQSVSSLKAAEDLSQRALVTLKTGVMSEYLARVGTILDQHPITINEVIITKDDWYAGVWNSTSMSDHSYGKTYGDEYDIYVGWAHTFDWVKLDLSTMYYAIADLGKLNDDLWVVEPQVSFPEVPFVTPYVRARYFGQIGSDSPKGGMFYFAGVTKDISLESWKLSLDAATAFGGGALRDSTGFIYGRVTASLNIPISSDWTLNPSMTYQIAAPGQASDPNGFTDGNKFIYGLSVSYKF